MFTFSIFPIGKVSVLKSAKVNRVKAAKNAKTWNNPQKSMKNNHHNIPV